ncbi:hypothetical protein PQR71_41555 [Paraburkholderia fungorum]|uniref:hypothetical protein n=1 Tax=Paraburkholderia fungorum TaxID=134537 RepID=UPI0038BB22F2
MEQTISIADLVQPKFKAGQTVWVVTRDYNRRVSNIRSMNIRRIGFTVAIANEKGVEKRTATLHYFDGSDSAYLENQLLASLNDLSESDRKPLVG